MVAMEPVINLAFFIPILFASFVSQPCFEQIHTVYGIRNTAHTKMPLGCVTLNPPQHRRNPATLVSLYLFESVVASINKAAAAGTRHIVARFGNRGHTASNTQGDAGKTRETMAPVATRSLDSFGNTWLIK